MKKARAALALIVAALLPLSVVGCSRNPAADAPPDEQRFIEIVKKSGGDWKSVSQSDRDFLTRKFGNGDERSAQMRFLARWGALKGGPPAPPR